MTVYACCTDHNKRHKSFSCNKDSLCVLSSAGSALNFRHIESVLIVFHTQTIFCCCQTQDGFSSVHAASENGHTEVVDLLVQAGADIHLPTTDEVHVSTHRVSSSGGGSRAKKGRGCHCTATLQSCICMSNMISSP